MPKHGVTIYQPLADYLAALPPEVAEVELTLDEIGVILGSPLSPSARLPAFWTGGKSYIHMRAWHRAGWRVAKGPGARFGQRVRFVRVDAM